MGGLREGSVGGGAVECGVEGAGIDGGGDCVAFVVGGICE